MDITFILLAVFFLGSIIALPSQFYIARIMRDQGMKTYFLFLQPSDVRKFKEYIKSVKDPVRRKKLRKLFFWYWIPLLIAIVAFAGLVVIALSNR